VVGDTVYVSQPGLGAGTLAAVRLSDGGIRWSAPIASTISDLGFSLVGDMIYMISDDSYLIAYSAHDGSRLWKTANKLSLSGIAGRIPVGDSSAVYFGGDDGRLVAFNLADGSVKWSFASGGAFPYTPVLANGVLYVGSKDQYFYAINAADGSMRWRYSGGTDTYFPPAVTDKAIYLPNGPAIDALDPGAGTALWTAPLDAADYTLFIAGPLAVSTDTIFAPVGPYLYAFSATTQKVAWRFASRATDSNRLPPLLAGTTAFWPGENGGIYALDIAASA
jgi:outer membrane protein assembly factor BamB